MRIIAGKYKGHFLKTPKGLKIRPTSQKIKEALFNILGQEICGASFLELFAGTGNISIEALSRGAQKVFLVENNRTCIKTMERNLQQLKIEYNYGLKSGEKEKIALTILPLEAVKAIKMLQLRKEKFNFIFLDPPYDQSQLKNCLIKLELYDILSPLSYVIAEHRKSLILPQHLLKLRLMFTKRYGDSHLSFYQNRPKP